MSYYLISATFPTERDPRGGLKWEKAEFFPSLEVARKEQEKRARAHLRSLPKADRERVKRQDMHGYTDREYFDVFIWGDTGAVNGWKMTIDGLRYSGIVSTDPRDAREDYDEAALNLDYLYYKNVFVATRGVIPEALIEEIRRCEPRLYAREFLKTVSVADTSNQQ